MLTTQELQTSLQTYKKIAHPTVSIDRTIEWMGGVNQDTYSDVIAKLKNLLITNSREHITLIVTSPGGSTGIGMSFYDVVRKIFKPKLTTIGSGDVDSSGIIIFLSGEKRYLTANTTLLLHMGGRNFDNTKRFTTLEMRSILQEDTIKDEQYARVIAERSGGKLTEQRTLELMRNNTILTAEQAVDLGLAHAIL